MRNKTLEAAFIGFSIWIAGALLLILFRQEPFLRPLAIPIAFLMAPIMYLITRAHLRNVPVKERANAAMRLGVVAAAVQFPLDALGLFSIFRYNYPQIAPEAREALIIALEIGYFWILTIPWLAGKSKH